jgi:hypothetical protein
LAARSAVTDDVRVRLRDVTLADADLIDSWESPAIRGRV